MQSGNADPSMNSVCDLGKKYGKDFPYHGPCRLFACDIRGEIQEKIPHG
jgi:hypothetical protein